MIRVENTHAEPNTYRARFLKQYLFWPEIDCTAIPVIHCNQLHFILIFITI